MLVLGHRGARNSHFENTLESLVAAFELGCDGVEFDIHLSRDGVPILHHDPTLRRMVGLDARIADLTWQEIIDRTADSPVSVDALINVLPVVIRRGWLDIEIKEGLATKPVLDLLSAYPDRQRVAISSFAPEVLQQVANSGQPVKVWLNAKDYSDRTVRQAHAVGAAALILPARAITPRSVRRTKAAGLRIGCWGIDRLRNLTALDNLGVDIAIPDLPLRV